MSLLLVAVSIASCATSADPPLPVMKDGLANYLATKGQERARERAQAELRIAEGRLAIAKRGQIIRGQTEVRELPSNQDLRNVTYPHRKSKDDYIKARESDLKEAKDKLTRKLTPLAPPLSVGSMKAGAVGELHFGENSRFGGPSFVDVVQVIDKGNMIVRFDDSLLWLEHDTTGVIDDAKLSMAGICWQVIGTKTYASTDGASKTVFHLSPLK